MSSQTDERPYGLYLLPFDLEARGKASAIATMWRNFETKKSLAGIDAAVGGFQSFFPTFMVDNWNRPGADRYNTYDGLTEGALVREDPRVVPLSANKIPMPLSLRYLSSEYRYFRFESDVKTITFDNPIQADPKASVWAIEKIAGSWNAPIDLSDQPSKTWCRDHDDLQELVLAFGNIEWPKTPAQERNLTSLILRSAPTAPPVVEVFGSGCNAWEGQADVQYTMSAEGITLTETAHASVRFVPNDDFNVTGEPIEYWKAVSGSITWTASMSGKCTGSYRGTIAIVPDPNGDLPGVLQISDRDDGRDPSGKRILRYYGGSAPFPINQDPLFAWNCGSYTVPGRLTVAESWFQTAAEGHRMTEGATSFGDRRSFAHTVGTITASWTFRASR